MSCLAVCLVLIFGLLIEITFGLVDLNCAYFWYFRFATACLKQNAGSLRAAFWAISWLFNACSH